MDITSYFQSRVRCLTPATIALAVMAGPEENFIGSCCPVARIFMLVPPISITSTFIIEVSRYIDEDNHGEVGSRLAAKVRSSRNSTCWQLSAVVHHQPVAFQHRRISRVLIEIAQCWIIETGAVEQVGAGLGHHRDQTEMNKFRRLFANDMDAEQSHVVLAEDQFQQTAFIADNLAARIIGITRPTDHVADALRLQRLFGFTSHARLWNRVNAGRQHRCDHVFVVKLERDAYREARLFHARRGERRCPNNITRRENMRNLRATMRIHLDQTAFTRCETSRGEIEIGRIALASGSDEHVVHCDGRAGGERERYFSVRRRIAPHDFFFPDKMHTRRRHRTLDVFRNLAIEKTEERIASVNEMHLNTERGKRAGIFSADYPRADDSECFRKCADLQNFVRVMHVRMLEWELRRTHWR